MYERKRLVIYPSPELYKQLQRVAEREQTSMKKVLMRLLRENLDNKQSGEH